MKKKILLLCFALFGLFSIQAQTAFLVSGYVTDSNGVAINNHTVYIMSDSVNAFMYAATTTTNANGYYSFAITNVPILGPGFNFYIHTYDCNGIPHSSVFTNANPQNVVNFMICNGTLTTCNAFYSYVLASGSTNTYNFHDYSTGNPVSWSWNFGDGATSTLQNPSHTYNAIGSFVISLAITTASNCTSVYYDSVYVQSTSNTCHANFNYYQDSLNNHKYYFSNISTTTYQNLQIQYLWNFGDGYTSTSVNPDHIFPTTVAATTYNVCLTIKVLNSSSVIECQSTTCKSVTIANTNTNTCHANFNYYSDSNSTINTIHFINSSTSSYPNLQIVYLWNFGDGGTSTLQHPVHTYLNNPVAASYNVCLTIKVLNSANVIECQNTYCVYVTIGNPTTGCQNSFTFGHQNLVYNFNGNINSSNPTTYNWSFGDGTSATGQNVTHTFAQPSSGSNGYHVCLITVTSNNSGSSCTDSSCQFISIANTTGNIIHGFVTAGNYDVNDGYVLLYMANNATMSYTLIDTLSLDSIGYFHYENLTVPPVNPAFLIKAVINPSASYFTQYAPTFYLHAINWFNATAVFPSASSVFYNINMVQLPVNPITGTGTLGGNVFQGGFKSFGDSPLSGVELILTDEYDSPLKISYSNTNGNFSFLNLPMGNYKLHVEIAGVNYTPYLVTLSASNPGINNITVTVNTTGAIITGIENNSDHSSSISDIYPNPATSEAFLEIQTSKTEDVVISIYNYAGVRLSTAGYKVNGSQRVNLNQNHFTTGIYTVKIEATNGMSSVRKLVIAK